MDASTTAEPAAAASLPVAVFGLDDLGKAHASRFTAGEAELATKAAGLMGMHVLALASPDCGDLAERLPAGRIFGKSGKAFVPFVARPMFDRLATLSGIPLPPPGAKPERVPKPEKAPKPAKGEKAASADKGVKLAASNLSPSADVEASGVPTDWPIIREGSLVLATTGGVADGWFESIVVEAKSDDLMVCRWRDFADEALFLRRRDQLALLPAGTPLTPKA